LLNIPRAGLGCSSRRPKQSAERRFVGRASDSLVCSVCTQCVQMTLLAAEPACR
jgi:hypothetical protein